MDKKFCVNCAHYRPPGPSAGGGYSKSGCMNPNNVDLETGTVGAYPPGILRGLRDMCGPGAVWFAEMPPVVVLPAKEPPAPASLRPPKKRAQRRPR